MSTRLALRIQQRLDKLSPSERKLAGLVLEHQDDLLTYSATELAGFAGVSKATAARLFRSLGYSDFNEVRLQAREERNRTAPFELKPAGHVGRSSARSVGDHLKAELTSLTRTFEEMRSDLVAEAADLLVEAPRVWLLGLGLEDGLARYGRLLLARLRSDVHLLNGQMGGGWVEDLAMTGAGDALVVLSVQPRPKLLRPLLEYARTTRMAIVAVVDPGSVAWARRFARLTLQCHGAGPQPGATHTALLSTVNLLAGALTDRLGRAASQRTDLLAEIHEELDDED